VECNLMFNPDQFKKLKSSFRISYRGRVCMLMINT